MIAESDSESDDVEDEVCGVCYYWPCHCCVKCHAFPCRCAAPAAMGVASLPCNAPKSSRQALTAPRADRWEAAVAAEVTSICDSCAINALAATNHSWRRSCLNGG